MNRRDPLEEIRAWAALHALGALDAEEAARFEQRLASGCPLCRTEFKASCEALALLALGVEPVEPPPGARTRLLEAVEQVVPASNGPAADGAAPQPEILVVRADEGGWTPGPVPGVHVRPLVDTRTVLVRMEPGASFPAHDHARMEQCLVLEGSLASGHLTVRAGDFTCAPAGSHHPALHTTTGCLLLVCYV